VGGKKLAAIGFFLGILIAVARSRNLRWIWRDSDPDA
jgi:hypothetical protein